MISGEWAILEEGGACLVMAFDRGIVAKLTWNSTLQISMPDLKIKNLPLKFLDGHLKVLTEFLPIQIAKPQISLFALNTTLRFLENCKVPIKPFHLLVFSKGTQILYQEKILKLGLGASAACCVAITSAILYAHHYPIDPERKVIFKLASIAHFSSQNFTGSGFDIAASTIGGTLYYKSFLRSWLKNQISKKTPIKNLIEKSWPNLFWEKLPAPPSPWIIGFSGKSANTSQLIESMIETRDQHSQRYQSITNDILYIVEKLKISLKHQDKNKWLELIRHNRRKLLDLSYLNHNQLETPNLTLLLDTVEKYYGAGKFSGAGGGDCAWAFLPDISLSENLKKAWSHFEILSIKMNIATKGIDKM